MSSFGEDAIMLIGYARISTIEQNLDLQLDALSKAGCSKIFHDTASGAKGVRMGLSEALEYAREGDTLVVWRLDRLGRSLAQLIDFMKNLKARGIGFRSIVDTIDTTTSMGQFFFHVTGAFSELERNLIRERTLAGLEAARARGRNGGRPKALDEQDALMAFELHQSNKATVEAISKRFGVGKRTLYRYFRRSSLLESKLNFSKTTIDAKQISQRNTTAALDPY